METFSHENKATRWEPSHPLGTWYVIRCTINTRCCSRYIGMVSGEPAYVDDLYLVYFSHARLLSLPDHGRSHVGHSLVLSPRSCSREGTVRIA